MRVLITFLAVLGALAGVSLLGYALGPAIDRFLDSIDEYLVRRSRRTNR
jgi:hypothetical protein